MEGETLLVPPLHELDAVEGGGGQHYLLSRHVVDGVATVTKVAVGAVLTNTGTVLVVEGCREVHMSDVKSFVPTTADTTGCALIEGAHGVQHRGAVLRSHPEADVQQGDQ